MSDGGPLGDEKGKAKPMFSHECLRNNAFFKGRDPKFLDKIMENISVEVYCAGEDIMKEGEFGDSMYFLHRGSVEILVGPDQDRVAVLDDGNIFGEMAVLGLANKRASTVRALEFCDCRVVHQRPFMSLLKRFPDEQAYFMNMAKQRQADLKEVEKKSEPKSELPVSQMRRLSRRVSAAMLVNKTFGGRRHSSVGPPSGLATPNRVPSPRPGLPSMVPPFLSSVGETTESRGSIKIAWNTKIALVRAKLQAISAFSKIGTPSPAPPEQPSPSNSDCNGNSPTSVRAIVGAILGGRRKSHHAKSAVQSRRHSNIWGTAVSAAASQAVSRRMSFAESALTSQAASRRISLSGEGAQTASQAPSRKMSLSEVRVRGVLPHESPRVSTIYFDPGSLGSPRRVVGLDQPQVDFQEISSNRQHRASISLSNSGEDEEAMSRVIDRIAAKKKRSHSIALTCAKTLLPDLTQAENTGDGQSSSIISFSIPADRSSDSASTSAPLSQTSALKSGTAGTRPNGGLLLPGKADGQQDSLSARSSPTFGGSVQDPDELETVPMKLSSSLREWATEEELAVLHELASKIEHTEGDHSHSDSEHSDHSEHYEPAEMAFESTKSQGSSRGTLLIPEVRRGSRSAIPGQLELMYENISSGGYSATPITHPMTMQQLNTVSTPKNSRRKPLLAIQPQASTGRKLASRYDCTPWRPRRGPNPQTIGISSCTSSTSKLAQYPAPELPRMQVRPLQAETPLGMEPWALIGESEPHHAMGGPHRLVASVTPFAMQRRRFAMYGGRKRAAKTPGTAPSSRPQTRGLESPPRANTAGSVGTAGLFNSDSREELPQRARTAGTLGMGPLFASSDFIDPSSRRLEAQICADDDDGWHFIPACGSPDGSDVPMLPMFPQDITLQRQKDVEQAPGSWFDTAEDAGQAYDSNLRSEAAFDVECIDARAAVDTPASARSEASMRPRLSIIETAIHKLPTTGQMRVRPPPILMKH